MAITTIYGASDDLIELEGQLNEEFNPSYQRKTPSLLAFSDGTLLEMWYDNDGIWRIKQLIAGISAYTHEAGSIADDTPDKVTLMGDLRWCVLGERGPSNPIFGNVRKT